MPVRLSGGGMVSVPIGLGKEGVVPVPVSLVSVSVKVEDLWKYALCHFRAETLL